MTDSFASKVVSFTPGFSPVERHFNCSIDRLSSITGLKPGVNETIFEAKND